MSWNNLSLRIALVLFTGLLALIGPAFGQGGTGRETPRPTPTPKTERPNPRPASPVVNLEGTTWGLEGREGSKFLGKGVFEFLADGKVQIDGDIDVTATWKQMGRRVVIAFSEGRSKSTMDGLITGNQINGTMTGKGENGENRQAKFSAKRADADLMAELSFWKSIKDSTNPEDFKTYLAKYPYGAFVAEAVTKMKALEAKKKSPEPGPGTADEAVANLEGTTWGFEAREGTKLLSKGVLEFLAGGKLQVNGDEVPVTWKQSGSRFAITSSDSQMEGSVTGNQFSGTATAKSDDGATKKAELSGKRADDELMAELNYWKSIKASTNPDDFKKYLEKYPYGTFVPDALVKIKALEAKKPDPGTTNLSSSNARPNQAADSVALHSNQ